MNAPAEPFLGVGRSVTGRLWQARPGSERTAQALSQRLGVPDVVGRVLAARGVDVDGGETFLNPTLRDAMPDPTCLRDMDRAVARLADALSADEKIAVFGDYDVDGATSSALLRRYFAAVGHSVTVYIPDRQREGYGPNADALRALRQSGHDVVVTVDCGIVAFDALAQARDAGLDVIVVDHHQAEPRLPASHAVVNPNRLDDESPCKQLAAVGVTFLLLVALNRELRRRGWFADRAEPDLRAWLDIVALGTVCDVVPLTGLNRALVTQGLKVMTQRLNPGLQALAEVAGMASRPEAFHLGFLLGPRVNAGGRIGKSDLGVRLLATDDPAEAHALAEELDGLNRERQSIEAAMIEQAVEMAGAAAQDGKPLLFVASDQWHEGVIGIVASRLKDRFHRPAIVFATNGEVAKGSGRSVVGVDLGSAVTAAKQAGLLLNGGGHAMAAGLSVEVGRLGEVEAFLADRIGRQLQDLPDVPDLPFDGAVSVRAVTRDLYDLLETAGPYGAGNPEPRFAVTGADIVKADVVGSNHVRVIAAGGDGGRLKAIAFGAADAPLGRLLMTTRGARVHLAGHLRADDWQGRRGVQLVLEDAAPMAGTS